MNAAWITSDIQCLVNAHYGMPMRITVQPRDEHSLCRPEDPMGMGYYDRLICEWDSETGPCVDLVVWDNTTDSLQLVQTLCFKDSYVTRAAWLCAIRNLVRDNVSVWIVRHLE